MRWRSTAAAVIAVGIVGSAPALAAAQAPVPVTPAPVAPAPGVIATGVSIAEVPVAGLTAAAATQAVLATHVAPRRLPVALTFRGRRLAVDPVKVGYTADVAYAVQVAMIYGRTKAVPAEGVVVPLKEKVNRARLRATLKLRAAKHDLPARDATLRLKGVTPVVTKARIGIAIDVGKSAPIVESAILTRARPSFALAASRVIPAVTSVGPVVVIDRGNFRLTYWKAGKRIAFPIAVGSPDHPTPTGDFAIIQKQTNPTWFPPDSPWAAGLGPVPPGVSNPLGTRWMGTSAPAIGMHGTPTSSSIGTRASHGCIRMYIHDAERLYDLVDIGTPVYIR
jgi:lipoprotein-anchoring transpeptidase ErfK/SrfK